MVVGDEISGWRLISELDAGGNGVVWEVEGDTGRRALKVLHRRDTEGRRRFEDELRAMDSLVDVPGVLPVLDRGELDSTEAASWFVMPLATPVRVVLGENPDLVDVVAACAAFASTLAEAAERGFHHRDIKPENLFRCNGAWVIGDWGLVAFPGKQQLTAEGKLGSHYYLAPEMLDDGSSAAPGPADVYALAKVLWVLAGGAELPRQGPLLSDAKGHRLTARVAGPRVYLLDRLIERSTVDDPDLRPSVAAVATDLLSWLSLIDEVPLVSELDTASHALYSHLEPSANPDFGRSWSDDQKGYVGGWLAGQWAGSALQPTAEALCHLAPSEGLAEVNQEIWSLVRRRPAGPGVPAVVTQGGRAITAKGPGTIRLCSGIAFLLDAEGVVHMASGHWLWNRHGLVEDLGILELEALPGSASEELNRHRLLAHVEGGLEPAFARFVDEVVANGAIEEVP